MKTNKSRTLDHIITTTISNIVLFIILAVLFIAVDVFDTTSAVYGTTFAVFVLFNLIFQVVITIIFSEDKTKPHNLLIAIIVISLLIATLLTFSMFYYNQLNARLNDGEEEGDMIQIIISLFMSLILIAAYIALQWMSSIFLMVSLCNKRTSEWDIKKTFGLLTTKTNIIHSSKGFSYLYNDKKLLILKFITEDQVERQINYSQSERGNKSLLILELEEQKERVDKILNTNSHASLVYLSNKLPKTIGKKENGIIILKDSDVFAYFKKYTPIHHYDSQLIEQGALND